MPISALVPLCPCVGSLPEAADGRKRKEEEGSAESAVQACSSRFALQLACWWLLLQLSSTFEFPVQVCVCVRARTAVYRGIMFVY